MNKTDVFNFIDDNEKVFTNVSDKIWNYAELAFTETKSMEEICKVLDEFGFNVEKGMAEIPTAFKGTYGSGKPVIGILGEYDALPALNQKESCAERQEDVHGGNGHGCGHNMLGSGSLAAAVAIKEYLKVNNKPGTVIYFGCPAEEGGAGKAFMVREGVFDGLDIALTWHPNSLNLVLGISTLANYQINYSFKGIASHAAASPQLGRSALDAVELMNVGANFLREHIIQEARLHYAIIDAGGTAPNVVQPFAKVTYLVRAPKNYQVQEIYERLNMVAQGAAMMTQTELSVDFAKACANVVNNRTLEQQLQNNLIEVGAPTYTDEELAFAKQINDTLGQKNATFASIAGKAFAAKVAKQEIITEIMPYTPIDMALPGSSDVGDVSWIVPTAQITAACYARSTPDHSWQLVSQGKSSVAHKGLIYAAKVLAATAIDLIEQPELIEKAKEDFLLELEGRTYEPAIPKEKKPAIPKK